MIAASPRPQQEPLTTDAWRWGRSDFAFAPVVLLSAAAGSQVGLPGCHELDWGPGAGLVGFISSSQNWGMPQFMVILW